MIATDNNSPATENKNDKVIIGLIILSFLLIVFSLLAPIIFTKITTNPRYNFKETGAIGDTIGGLMNPFIALAGVFITFLAFYMQFKANKIQIDLFHKNQKEQTDLLKEQLFFRLVDNLNQRIINFSYTDDEIDRSLDHQSYKALDNLAKKFLYKIDYKCIALGRQLLASIPEKIDIVHYVKIVQANSLNDLPIIENAEQLRDSIVAIKTFNERWEYIKVYVGSTDSTNEQVNNALKSIGHVNFYNTPFTEREGIYISTYDEIYRDFGGFLDGYTKNITYLIDFTNKNSNNPFFLDYLKSNLSTQELILIFYFCASRKSNANIRSQIKKINFLEDIGQAREKFIDVPSKITLLEELGLILDRHDVRFG